MARVKSRQNLISGHLVVVFTIGLLVCYHRSIPGPSFHYFREFQVDFLGLFTMPLASRSSPIHHHVQRQTTLSASWQSIAIVNHFHNTVVLANGKNMRV